MTWCSVDNATPLFVLASSAIRCRFVDRFVRPKVLSRDWDRSRARPALGGGFPFLLFRLQDGFTFPPWLTFPEAPLKCRTARFPGSGLKPWHIFHGPSLGLERFKRWSVYTPAVPVCPQPRLLSRYGVCAGFIKPAAIRPRWPPSIQSLFAQIRCYLGWGDVIRLLGGSYSSVIAHTGSCATPVGLSPPSALSLVRRVFAGCTQSLLPTGAS